jgi:hypothetical protein
LYKDEERRKLFCQGTNCVSLDGGDFYIRRWGKHKGGTKVGEGRGEKKEGRHIRKKESQQSRGGGRSILKEVKRGGELQGDREGMGVEKGRRVTDKKRVVGCKEKWEEVG